MKKLLLGSLLLVAIVFPFIGNLVSAKAIDPSSIPSPIRGKADLTVANITLDQANCVSYTSARQVGVNYAIKNIGIYISSLYLVTIYVDGNFLVGTYDSSSTSKIPVMGTTSGLRLSIFGGGKREISVQVIPLNPLPSALGWQDAMTYSNRALDNNQNNNIMVKTVDIITCP